MEYNSFASFPGVTFEEMNFLQQMSANLTENQKRNFLSIYAGRRKSAQDILLFTLLGLIGFAGIHRFILGQVGMGILYFLTAGLCLIGTVVDLINYKSLTNEFNSKMAYESMQIAQMHP